MTTPQKRPTPPGMISMRDFQFHLRDHIATGGTFRVCRHGKLVAVVRIEAAQ